MLAIPIKNMDECLTVQGELFKLGFMWKDGSKCETYPQAFLTHIGIHKYKKRIEFLYSNETQDTTNFIEVTLEDVINIMPTPTKQGMLEVFEGEKAKVIKVLTDVVEHINTNNFKGVRSHLQCIDDDSGGWGKDNAEVLKFDCVDQVFIGDAVDYLEGLMRQADNAEDTQNRHKLLAIPIKSANHAKHLQSSLLAKGFGWRNKEHNTIYLPDFITHIGLVLKNKKMVYVYDNVPKDIYTEVTINDLPMYGIGTYYENIPDGMGYCWHTEKLYPLDELYYVDEREFWVHEEYADDY